MDMVFVTLLIFAALSASSLGCLIYHSRLPQKHRESDTVDVVRLVIGLFVVMTSLVLGLLINTAKNRFDAINRDIHTFATDLILLERTLELYGDEANETRRRLIAYVERAASTPLTSSDPLLVSDPISERMLDDVGASLRALKPSDDQRLAVWNDARAQYRAIVELRWGFIEQSEGSVPRPLLAMVVAWLILIFGSFGYRAPRNAVVVASFLLAAALISATLFMIVDLDIPFSGPMSISLAPIERALAEMKR